MKLVNQFLARVLSQVARYAANLSAMLFLLALLGAPHADAAGWARNYGTATASAGIYATAVDASGNVYITGYFDGAMLTLGGVTLNRVGTQDAFVAKLDTNGTVRWAKNYGGAGVILRGNGIAVDGSGNVYLGGEFSGASLTIPTLPLTGIQDAYVLKLDSFGNTIWAKNYGGAGANAWGSAIAVDGSGNVYLGGNFNSASLSTPTLPKIGTQDAYVLKLDSSGNTTWAKSYGGGSATTAGNAIAVDATGNVYLGGNFTGANLTSLSLTLIGIRDAFVLKLDASGNTTWAHDYNDVFMTGRGIAVDASGYVYLVGDTAYLFSQDAFLLQIDPSGSTFVAKYFGGVTAMAWGETIALDRFGNAYLGGEFDSGDLIAPPLTLTGTSDVFMLKIDALGKTTRVQNYSGSGAYANGLSIAVDAASGNAYLGGNFRSASLATPPLSLIGARDAFILKETATANPTYTGPTATGTGTATVYASGSGAGCGFTGTPQFVPPGSNAPPGVTFPHGLFNFTLGGCTPGSTVTLVVTYPSAVPAGTQYWKYGPTPGGGANTTPHWYTIPATVSGNTITFSITDGGLGDDDLTANGIIVDPGGAGVPGATSIPSLSNWSMLLLAGLLGLFGMRVVRQRSSHKYIGGTI